MARDRWGTMHVEADRRRPFGHVGERRPEPTRLTTNQVSIRILLGLAGGALISFLLTGQPW